MEEKSWKNICYSITNNDETPWECPEINYPKDKTYISPYSYYHYFTYSTTCPKCGGSISWNNSLTGCPYRYCPYCGAELCPDIDAKKEKILKLLKKLLELLEK